MKKILLGVLMIFACLPVFAQLPLVNGDFSLFTSSPPPSMCDIGGYVDHPSIVNWLRTHGEASIVGPHAIRFEQGSTGKGWIGVDPEGQGIAASYDFFTGGCYTVTLNMEGTIDHCGGTHISLFATSGLTQPPGPPTACGIPAPMPGSTWEPIYDHVDAHGEIFSSPPPIVYNASRDNSQIALFMNFYNCDLIHSFTLHSITIASCGDGEGCTDDILLINKSAMISPGGLYEHAGIKAGSMVASGGDPIVNAPMDKKTLLMGRWIKLEQKFSAVVYQGDYFEVLPTTACDDIPDPCSLPAIGGVPPFVVYGMGDFALTDAVAGGTWRSSVPSVASINASTGVVHIGGFGMATIAYTNGDCSVYTTLNVISEKIAQNGNTANPYANNQTNSPSDISIYPNPTQDNITISYPCNSAGQLDISVRDVAGRVRYNESVICNDGIGVQHTVDLSSFAPGVYFVDLTLNDQHTVKKIVKL